jgi:hypothetical protein
MGDHQKVIFLHFLLTAAIHALFLSSAAIQLVGFSFKFEPNLIFGNSSRRSLHFGRLKFRLKKLGPSFSWIFALHIHHAPQGVTWDHKGKLRPSSSHELLVGLLFRRPFASICAELVISNERFFVTLFSGMGALGPVTFFLRVVKHLLDNLPRSN